MKSADHFKRRALQQEIFLFCPFVSSDGNSLFDSMASGMRLIVSCISSFLILSLLLFMVHRLRQRRRERIETLIGGNRECCWTHTHDSLNDNLIMQFEAFSAELDNLLN